MAIAIYGGGQTNCPIYMRSGILSRVLHRFLISPIEICLTLPDYRGTGIPKR